MLILSLILPITFAFLLIHLLWASPQIINSQTAIKLFLSVGLGLGISSLSYWVFLNLSGSFNSFSIILEAAVFMVLILVCAVIQLKRKPLCNINEPFQKNEKESQDILTWHKIPFLTIGFWTAILCTVVLFVTRTLNNPHGSWDAWAIWNMRARFLYRSQEHWITAFSSMHGCTHTDYPLLIPAAISRIWGYIGSDTLHAPMIVAFLFTFSTVGLIVSAMILIKNRNHGYVTGLILLSLTFFTIHGAGQVADVPFGFFVLSTMVLFFLKDKLPEKSAVFCFLAGMMAGLSAWTKNEGLLFIIIILFSHFIVTVFKQGRASYFKEIRPLFLGLSPVILIIAHFKMNLDISNDLVSKRSAESLVKLLFDPERYLIVGKSYLYYLNKKFLAIIITFPLMLIALKLSGDKNIKVSSTISALAILLLLFGYFMIYIITPHDLAWHVKTSLSRLYLQVMPSVVFVFFMLLNSIGRQPDYGSRK